MTIKMTFLMSAVKSEDFPKGPKPEIAFVGRSNSGKSSFINALANQKVAFVSSSPGKTETLNFYDAGSKYRIVDTPGYGFAAKSPGKVRFWKHFVDAYFGARPQLSGVLLLMDSRRDWSDEEEQLVQWVREFDLDVVLALTKSDKLNKKEQMACLKNIEKRSNCENVFLTSISDEKSVSEVERFLFETFVKDNDLSKTIGAHE